MSSGKVRTMSKLKFPAVYSERNDDELLQLASDRSSLTNEAATALDDELRRRNLTESDRAKQQQFVMHNERREARRRQRRIFGSWRDRRSWTDLFWALLAMVLISFTYLALPTRYHLKPDWQDSAVVVMIPSVFIGVGGSLLWRKAAFWTSLFMSSGIHLVVVHLWIRKIGKLSHNQGELAVVLGFVLFFAVYGFVWRLRPSLYGQDAVDDR
jgi:hypothetical protein